VKVLVTGGAGFIGSALVRALAARPGVEVVVLDAFTYAGLPENLREVAGGVSVVEGDVADAAVVQRAMAGCGLVLHLAAESHVDRSIADAGDFVHTNVLGTRVVLDVAIGEGVERVVLASTDEVYGDLPLDGIRPFHEDDPLRPNSPYAASKAAGDLLARAWHRTHGLDVVVTRGSNSWGPRQLPEKLVPRMIVRARSGRTLPVFGDGRYVRDWLHVDDHVEGLLAAAERGRAGRAYNLGGGCERANLDVVRAIVDHLDADPGLIRHVNDRPGHDRRYAVDIARARDELGWAPTRPLETGLPGVIDWYLRNPAWVSAATARLGEWA